MQDLDIQVGDRITFIYKNKEIIEFVGSSQFINKTKEKVEILKIERIGANGWYTVYEKEKELLTEEREFLKQYIKFINEIVTGVKRSNSVLNFMQYKEEINYINTVNNFEGLENNRIYTLSELGLEK